MKKMPLFYHETKFSWYNSRKAAIILFLWPDDAQALPAPVPMANYTIPLPLHGIIAAAVIMLYRSGLLSQPGRELARVPSPLPPMLYKPRESPGVRLHRPGRRCSGVFYYKPCLRGLTIR